MVKLSLILIIKLFAILMILSGISLLIQQEIIIEWMESNRINNSLYFSAIIARFVFGISFVKSAEASKYPRIIKFLGYLFVVEAIIYIFIGQEIFQDLIAFLIPFVKPITQVSGLLSIAFGSFLIYAFVKEKKLTYK